MRDSKKCFYHIFDIDKFELSISRALKKKSNQAFYSEIISWHLLVKYFPIKHFTVKQSHGIYSLRLECLHITWYVKLKYLNIWQFQIKMIFFCASIETFFFSREISFSWNLYRLIFVGLLLVYAKKNHTTTVPSK